VTIRDEGTKDWRIERSCIRDGNICPPELKSGFDRKVDISMGAFVVKARGGSPINPPML
jgi:hypothetical protein